MAGNFKFWRGDYKNGGKMEFQGQDLLSILRTLLFGVATVLCCRMLNPACWWPFPAAKPVDTAFGCGDDERGRFRWMPLVSRILSPILGPML
jgi:hypothetical protein